MKSLDRGGLMRSMDYTWSHTYRSNEVTQGKRLQCH